MTPTDDQKAARERVNEFVRIGYFPLSDLACAKLITDLRTLLSERDEMAAENEKLRLAICGGEDAASMSIEQILEVAARASHIEAAVIAAANETVSERDALAERVAVLEGSQAWIKSFSEAHDAMQDALKAIAYHADNQDIGHVDFRMKAKGQAEFTLEQCAGDAGALDGPPLPEPEWTSKSTPDATVTSIVKRVWLAGYDRGRFSAASKHGTYADVVPKAASEILALAHPTPEALARPDEWQLIETAPKDGSRFMAYEAKDEAKFYPCWWQEDFGHWEGWQNVWDSEPEPTHWRPLYDEPAALSPSPATQPGDGQ